MRDPCGPISMPSQKDLSRQEDIIRQKYQASASRFEAALNNIFKKYGKDFTGDADEIDLRTGEVVVDNGHLRSLEAADLWTELANERESVGEIDTFPISSTDRSPQGAIAVSQDRRKSPVLPRLSPSRRLSNLAIQDITNPRTTSMVGKGRRRRRDRPNPRLKVPETSGLRNRPRRETKPAERFVNLCFPNERSPNGTRREYLKSILVRTRPT